MAYALPELLGMLFIEIVYLLLTVVLVMLYYCNRCSKNCCGVNNCFHSILKRTKIVKHVSETTTEFYGFLIEKNSFMTYFLVWYIVWTLCGAAIVFLDVLLIDVTNSCDPFASRTDCFLNNGFLYDLFNLYDEPIDCNNLTSLSDNATFICYKYTLNLGGAFGVAGGYFATGIMFLNVIGACYGKQTRCCNKDNCYMVYTIVGFIHLVVRTLLSATASIVVFTVPTLQQILIDDGTFILLFQFIHIQISLIMAQYYLIGIMICRPKQENTTTRLIK